MNEYHANNQSKWNASAERWQARYTEEDYAEAHERPASVLHPRVLQYLESIRKGKALVLSSGDNLAAVALSGLGFHVCSTDISEKQLHIVKEKTANLSTGIDFLPCDAAKASAHVHGPFDLVYFGGGAVVWYADVSAVLHECACLVSETGLIIIRDRHPFCDCLEAATDAKDYDYFDTSAKVYDASIKSPSLPAGFSQYEFHHTLSDIMAGALRANLTIAGVHEVEPITKKRVRHPAELILVLKKGEQNNE